MAPGATRDSPPKASCEATALRLLGIRMHSEAELSRKLARRGYDTDEIVRVMETCLRLGYLDDAAYATALVNRRASSRGAAAMAAELRAKGIRRDAVDAALAPIDLETEIEAAIALFARYADPGRDVNARRLLERVGSRLQRRGYGPQVVREACFRYLASATLIDPEYHGGASAPEV